jgi:hypothetical protein
MGDERTRWTDERLDDFATGIQSDVSDTRRSVSEINVTLGNMQADELKRLRERVDDAEREAERARTARREDRKWRVNLVAPILASAALTAASIATALLAAGVI